MEDVGGLCVSLQQQKKKAFILFEIWNCTSSFVFNSWSADLLKYNKNDVVVPTVFLVWRCTTALFPYIPDIIICFMIFGQWWYTS